MLQPQQRPEVRETRTCKTLDHCLRRGHTRAQFDNPPRAAEHGGASCGQELALRNGLGAALASANPLVTVAARILRRYSARAQWRFRHREPLHLKLRTWIGVGGPLTADLAVTLVSVAGW